MKCDYCGQDTISALKHQERSYSEVISDLENRLQLANRVIEVRLDTCNGYSELLQVRSIVSTPEGLIVEVSR